MPIQSVPENWEIKRRSSLLKAIFEAFPLLQNTICPPSRRRKWNRTSPMPAARSEICRSTFAEVEQSYFVFADRMLCAKFWPAVPPLINLRKDNNWFWVSYLTISIFYDILWHTPTNRITLPTEEVIQGPNARWGFSQLILHNANWWGLTQLHFLHIWYVSIAHVFLDFRRFQKVGFKAIPQLIWLMLFVLASAPQGYQLLLMSLILRDLQAICDMNEAKINQDLIYGT